MTRVIIPGVTHMAVINGCDGSAYALFFSSAERAERYLAEDGERFRDDILDISRGVEVDPLRYEWESFHTVVDNFISGPNSAAGVLALAEHFECAIRTVQNWGDGLEVPPPKTREQVLRFIRDWRPS